MAARDKKSKTAQFHPRNKHQGNYNFEALCAAFPQLKSFVKTNAHGNVSVNFSDPAAVKALNTALLFEQYQLHYWDIPEGCLCPPIPSRADYVHHLADVIDPKADSQIRILDIGTGANCIYPIIGVSAYNWSFVATDIDPVAIASAEEIAAKNPTLTHNISLRLQPSTQNIFRNIIIPGEKFTACMCNPPFHESEEAALKANARKTKNLNISPDLNFGGQHNELWCKGGEFRFVNRMITESVYYKDQCTWFTCLISKKENIRPLVNALKKISATHITKIPLLHGNKTSRILCWRF